MLLNRKELNYKDGLWYESLIESSNIIRVDYNTTQNKLYVYFKNKQVYSYTNVTKELYEQFENADSQGKFFIKNIRSNPNKYPYAFEFKFTDGELNEMNESIKEHKEKLKNEKSDS